MRECRLIHICYHMQVMDMCNLNQIVCKSEYLERLPVFYCIQNMIECTKKGEVSSASLRQIEKSERRAEKKGCLIGSFSVIRLLTRL